MYTRYIPVLPIRICHVCYATVQTLIHTKSWTELDSNMEISHAIFHIMHSLKFVCSFVLKGRNDHAAVAIGLSSLDSVHTYWVQICQVTTLHLTNGKTTLDVVRWRELPPMLHKRFPNLVGMVVDPTTRAYKIVVAGDYYEDNVRTEVYDSLSNCWRITGNHLPIANYTLRNAFCNGFHFWVTRDPYGVIAFNMQHGVWSVVRAPMPTFLTSPHLVGCQRRLLMVGGLKKHAIPKNIRIWELEQSTLNWNEVVRMPNSLSKRFLKDSRNGDFMCVGHNDLICLTSYKCPHALVYDFTKPSWRWVPSCPLLTDIEDYRSTIGFPFSPRLDAPV